MCVGKGRAGAGCVRVSDGRGAAGGAQSTTQHTEQAGVVSLTILSQVETSESAWVSGNVCVYVGGGVRMSNGRSGRRDPKCDSHTQSSQTTALAESLPACQRPPFVQH